MLVCQDKHYKNRIVLYFRNMLVNGDKCKLEAKRNPATALSPLSLCRRAQSTEQQTNQKIAGQWKQPTKPEAVHSFNKE